MICIGENLNVMSKTLGPAMKSRDAKPLQEMAKAEAEQGVDYIDLNIGPARKDGPETCPAALILPTRTHWLPD
jgi:5-methyltetrahydrofolate corrinoid/iron sulfur protein methyltransferase